MKIKILSTSDVHGYVYPTDYTSKTNKKQLGLLKAGSLIQNTKAKAADNEIVIAIENGDLLQGSPITSYMADHPKERHFLTNITNQIGYDAGILGNHEFNYGVNYIKDCEQLRNYPILAANITGIGDEPYVILNQKGLKIGILGLTTAYVPHWELKKIFPD